MNKRPKGGKKVEMRESRGNFTKSRGCLWGKKEAIAPPGSFQVSLYRNLDNKLNFGCILRYLKNQEGKGENPNTSILKTAGFYLI